MDASLELVKLLRKNNKISIIQSRGQLFKQVLDNLRIVVKFLLSSVRGWLIVCLVDHSFSINYIILRDLQFQLARSIYCSEYCCWMDHRNDFCMTK